MNIREQILGEMQPWVDHLDRLQQARAALAALTEQAEQERRERAVAEREHRAAVLAAAEAGTSVPDDLPPPSQGLATAIQYATDRVMAVAREAGDAKAEVADEVEARAREEHDMIAEAAKEHVDALTNAAADMSALLALVGEVRRAVEAQHPRRSDSPSSRTRPKIGAADLVEDVQAGVCTLEPIPRAGGLPSGVMIDRGPEPNEGFRHPLPARIPDRGRQV